MVVAVTAMPRTLVTLYRIGRDRHATKLLSITKPAWADRVFGAQLDASRNPAVCVMFAAFTANSDFRNETWCYPPGSTRGTKLSLDGMADLQMSPDGQHLVSASDTANDARFLVFSTRNAGSVIVNHRVNLKDTRNGGCEVTDTTWAGGPDLTLHCLGSDEDYPVYEVQSIAALTSGAVPGAGTALKPRGPLAKGYDAINNVTALDQDSAVGILQVTLRCGEMYGTQCPAGIPEPKVVRIDLHSGRVLEVVAFAAASRNLDGASGGSHGLVYVTEGGPKSEKRVYVRWPGEAHGQPVVGLPTVFDEVVTQH